VLDFSDDVTLSRITVFATTAVPEAGSLGLIACARRSIVISQIGAS
jgi:hypothetical protein